VCELLRERVASSIPEQACRFECELASPSTASTSTANTSTTSPSTSNTSFGEPVDREHVDREHVARLSRFHTSCVSFFLMKSLDVISGALRQGLEDRGFAIARSRSARVSQTIRGSLRFVRFVRVIVRESANQRVENHRGNGRTMMMNEGVESGRGVGVVAGLDEKLVKLHHTLKRIAKARAHLDLQEAEALREAQRLQLWRQFGHTSLPDYMVQELGYSSHRVAEDRLRLASALPQLPMISEAIQNGELNFSQARELSRIATKETEQAWIEKAKAMNVREVEQAVSEHCKGDLPDDPIDPKLVRKTMWLTVRPETEVLFRKAKQVLEKERGEKLDEDAVLEALCRTFMSGSRTNDDLNLASVPRGGDASSVPRGTETNSAEPVGTEIAVSERGAAASGAAPDGVAVASMGAPYRVAVTVCSDCMRGWQHGGGLVAEMTPPAVERAMCDGQWIGDINSNVVERARQEISPPMRRKVLHRDQERCRVPGCMSHTNLDVHHIWHLMYGGTNEMWNLLTLCEAHHLAHHEGTLVIELVGGEVVFRREWRINYTRATREVATREALREREYDRDQVREIMRRTVTHVGANDLSEPQWLAIALRYAETLAT
jgi:hypothetical protein